MIITKFANNQITPTCAQHNWCPVWGCLIPAVLQYYHNNLELINFNILLILEINSANL